MNEAKPLVLKRSNANFEQILAAVEAGRAVQAITDSGIICYLAAIDDNGSVFVQCTNTEIFAIMIYSDNSWQEQVLELPDKENYYTRDEIDEANFATKTYVAEQINNISAPDVSNQISAHNASSDSHYDIRQLINAIVVPTKVSQLDNDSKYLTSIPAEYITESELNAKKYLTSYNETDPTVPDWAKQPSKPSYTKSDIGLDNVDNVKQYSASNPPPYPVTSVNGKTGEVNLNQIIYIEGNSTEAGIWTGTHSEIANYFNGLTIAYKVNIAGISGGTTLNINGLGAVSVNRNASTAVTTTYPVGSVVILTYSDGKWLTADYDANTKNTAGTSNKTGTKMYLVGATSQTSSGTTTYTNTNTYVGTDNCLYSGGSKVLTQNDKAEIAEYVLSTLSTWTGGTY